MSGRTSDGKYTHAQPTHIHTPSSHSATQQSNSNRRQSPRRRALCWPRYSFLFALANYTVISIEPSSRNRAAIRATMCLNPELASRMTLVPRAVDAVPSERHCALRTWDAADGNGKLDCSPTATDDPCVRPAGAPPCRKPPCVCEAVRISSLDRILASHLPHGRGDAELVVSKFDVEGHECEGLAGGQSLFTHLRVDLLQYEGLQRATAKCMSEAAHTHGYVVGTRRGHDQNTVMRRAHD